jgi:hypothetical protein
LYGRGALDGKMTFQEIERMMNDKTEQRIKSFIDNNDQKSASDLSSQMLNYFVQMNAPGSDKFDPEE